MCRCDGLVFYPAYGNSCFYLKTSHTRDIVSTIDSSPVVVEYMSLDTVAVRVRIRWDKDHTNSRVDTVDGKKMEYSPPGFEHLIHGPQNDRKKISMIALTFGNVVLTCSYVWFLDQDNYGFLRTGYTEFGDYGSMVRKFLMDYPSGFNEQSLKDNPSASLVARTLFYRECVEMRFEKGVMSYCYHDSRRNIKLDDCPEFFRPNSSYHGKQGWKENQGLSLFVYPRGYSGCSVFVPPNPMIDFFFNLAVLGYW